MKTKKGNKKWKEKKQIGEKREFYQPVAKYEKQANISTRTSAKSSSVLKEKKKKKKKKTTAKSNLYKWTTREEDRYSKRIYVIAHSIVIRRYSENKFVIGYYKKLS